MAENSSSGGGLVAVALIAGIVMVVFPTLNPGRKSTSQNPQFTEPFTQPLLAKGRGKLHEQDNPDEAAQKIEGDWTIPEVREIHYAADEQGCFNLEDLFINHGLDLKLYWSGDMPNRQQTPPLKRKCVFVGKDAGNHDVLIDTRYFRPEH